MCKAWNPSASGLYVFALLAHTNKTNIDPLDVSHWRFYALPTCALKARTRSQHSITLRTLEKLCGAGCPFQELGAAVTRAALDGGLPSTALHPTGAV